MHSEPCKYNALQSRSMGDNVFNRFKFISSTTKRIYVYFSMGQILLSKALLLSMWNRNGCKLSKSLWSTIQLFLIPKFWKRDDYWIREELCILLKINMRRHCVNSSVTHRKVLFVGPFYGWRDILFHYSLYNHRRVLPRHSFGERDIREYEKKILLTSVGCLKIIN